MPPQNAPGKSLNSPLGLLKRNISNRYSPVLQGSRSRSCHPHLGFLSLTSWISVLAGGFRIYGIGGRWRQTGIGKIGWHTLRHSFATALDVAGARMKVAQELMRHANIATTMDVYTGSRNAKKERRPRVSRSRFWVWSNEQFALSNPNEPKLIFGERL